MSNIMKFFVMALAWLLFFLITFYTCVKPTCCPEGGGDGAVAPTEQPATPAVTNDYAIASNLGDAAVLTGGLWPALRDSLVSAYAANPDQLLNVYGYYYGSEPVPDGFENMGLMRAQAIKDLVVRETDIPADRILTLAERLDGAPAASPWIAGKFGLKAAPKTEDAPEIVQLDKDEIDILFPFNSAQKDIDPAIDAYLVKLAERLKQTNERVVLTGHTDNVDTDEFNLKLGQRRADFVKDILVRNGAPADRITATSEGESNPRASNATDDGRRQNRRTNVKLSAQ